MLRHKTPRSFCNLWPRTPPLCFICKAATLQECSLIRLNLTQKLDVAVKLRLLFCCGRCTISTLQATVCSRRGSFGLQGSKEAHFAWEACCYFHFIPPHTTALPYHQGGQRQTSLDKDAMFNLLFTATNLDTRATEPLNDTPATEEASESPTGGDRLKFCLRGERMHTELGREERKQMLQGTDPSQLPQILGSWLLPTNWWHKRQGRSGADSPAQRGDG